MNHLSLKSHILVENDTFWSKMAHFGRKWHILVENGTFWYKMTHSGKKWQILKYTLLLKFISPESIFFEKKNFFVKISEVFQYRRKPKPIFRTVLNWQIFSLEMYLGQLISRIRGCNYFRYTSRNYVSFLLGLLK